MLGTEQKCDICFCKWTKYNYFSLQKIGMIFFGGVEMHLEDILDVSPRSPLILTRAYWVSICAVDIGGLHTLRSESLKLVFQPLRKFLVNRL